MSWIDEPIEPHPWRKRRSEKLLTMADFIDGLTKNPVTIDIRMERDLNKIFPPNFLRDPQSSIKLRKGNAPKKSA